MSRKRSEAELYRARSGFREGDPIGRPCLRCERQTPSPGPFPSELGKGSLAQRDARYFAWAAALSRVCLQFHRR